MTPDAIDADVAASAVDLDERFDRGLPRLVAWLRDAGVSDAEMPDAPAEVHHEFWQTRCALLARLRRALERAR